MPFILDSTTGLTVSPPIAVAQGGTGAATAAAARTSLDVTYPAHGRVVRTAGDVTTTSTSLVDTPGATVTFTTGAFPVAYGAAQTSYNNTAGAHMLSNVAVDGVLQIGTSGIRYYQIGVNNRTNASFSGITATLTAASHTIKQVWRVSEGTGTIEAGTDFAHLFYAHEIR